MSPNDTQRVIRTILTARTRHALQDGSQIVMVEPHELAALLGIDTEQSEPSDMDTAQLDDLGMAHARFELRCQEVTEQIKTQ